MDEFRPSGSAEAQQGGEIVSEVLPVTTDKALAGLVKLQAQAFGFRADEHQLGVAGVLERQMKQALSGLSEAPIASHRQQALSLEIDVSKIPAITALIAGQSLSIVEQQFLTPTLVQRDVKAADAVEDPTIAKPFRFLEMLRPSTTLVATPVIVHFVKVRCQIVVAEIAVGAGEMLGTACEALQAAGQHAFFVTRALSISSLSSRYSSGSPYLWVQTHI